MSFTVLIPDEIAYSCGQQLERLGQYRILYGGGTDEASLLRNIADVDAAAAGHETYSRKVMEAGKKLRCVARFGVGYDTVDISAATDLGIQVTNTPTALTNAVAEHTLALILALAKKIAYMDKRVRWGGWGARNDNAHISIEVAGKTLGLIGLGRIGREVARKAGGCLGMRMLAYDPFLPPEKFPEGIERKTGLDDIFANADFVSLHLPSMPENSGLIGQRHFSLMRKGSFFINCARGDIVDEAALADALRNGPMAAAGLDVLIDEPPKADNPFLAMDNVVFTPHTASFTPEARGAMAESVAQSIDEVLRGVAATYPVNSPGKRKHA
jgi:D-3-phosphoglycerate dehydrogenase